MRKYNNIRNLQKPIKGLCCAYYFHGNRVDEQYILDQIKIIDNASGKLNFDFIQIDSGYCVWGDWLDTNDKFPSGMKFIVQEIKSRGMKAGIWFSPFMADTRSEIFKNHKEWFLRDDKKNIIVKPFFVPIHSTPLFIAALDPTHPGVQKYLTKVVKQYMSWGFELIKIDFTYTTCFSSNYFKDVTRARALRLGLETLRKAGGKKMHILSAISPLSPLVGIVDSARVGLDSIFPYTCSIPVLNSIVNEYMIKEDLRNCKTRQFFNDKIWINDADCFVCRENTGLKKETVEMNFKFLKNYGGSIWIGDNLKLLDREKLEKYVIRLLK